MCPNDTSLTAFGTKNFVAADEEASASRMFQNTCGIGRNKVGTSAGLIDVYVPGTEHESEVKLIENLNHSENRSLITSQIDYLFI